MAETVEKVKRGATVVATDGQRSCGTAARTVAEAMPGSTDLEIALDDSERLGVNLVATLSGAAARVRAGVSGVSESSIPPPLPTNARASRDFTDAIERHEVLAEELLTSLRSALGTRARESGSNIVVPERERSPAKAKVPPPLQQKLDLVPDAAPKRGLEIGLENMMYRVVNRGIIRAGFESSSQVLGVLERGDTVRPLEIRVNDQGQQRVRFEFTVGPRASSPVSATMADILATVILYPLTHFMPHCRRRVW